MRQRHQCASMVGRWRISLPPIAAFWALLIAGSLITVNCAYSATAAEPEYAQTISTRLNTTGRTVAFPVPLKDGDQNLGEVTLQITAEDNLLIEKTALVEKISALLGEEAGGVLNALEAPSGFIPIEACTASGLDVRFDAGLQELHIVLSADQRPTGDLHLGGQQMPRVSAAISHPEFASGYLNVIGGVDQMWQSTAPGGTKIDGETSGRLELESAARVAGIVFENRATMEGDVDTTICPKEASCTYGHVAGLKRQASRAVYDIPSEQIRVMAGDTDALAIPLQRATEVLGLSIEKSARKLNPLESTYASSAGSFRLEQASSVQVIVNGAVVQLLQLRPGSYNLRDLPLTTGANNIELIVTQENGERQTLQFTTYSDQTLLAAGKSEWAITGGLPSYLLDNERTYADNAFLGSGYLRYGLTDDLTGEADLQGDANVVMGGIGLDIETKLGVVGLHGAASAGSSKNGIAADASWSMANFSGLSAQRGENLNLSAEYRSTDFHTPGEFLNGADGILFPEFNYWLRLNGSYSLPVGHDITATVSGRYQFGDDDRTFSTSYNVTGNRYGADLTLSTPIGSSANASMLVGYSNEIYLRNANPTASQDADFRIALRFNVRPDEATSISAGYDTLGNQSNVSAYRGETAGINHWDTSVDIQNRDYEKSASINASAGVRGNRGEARISHFADATGVSMSEFDQASTRQRTSVRVGTAIAFAGGKVAIGAPVRGSAFAIVTPHESLASREITVGSADNVRAETGELGNALVSDLSAYVPESIPVDVDNLPLGYSLGSSAFDTFAPYKAGYALEVGSAYSVSVYGTLVLADGTPVSLITGLARREGESGKTITIFTNGEGKFGADGLAPGRWVLDMATEGGATQFVIDVPNGSNGLIKAGTLKPSQGSEK